VPSPGEFELIDLFTRRMPVRGPGVVTGIGDDAAVLRAPRGELLVATVDAVMEGVHFGPGFTPADVGWKALAVNLSDVAAMGARPLWALVGLATPPGEDPARLAGVGRGLAACARAAGVTVVGGNVTSADRLSLTVTVLGSARAADILRRGGARPGDLLVVSGTLGDAALGLEPGAAASLVRRQRRPVARLALGRALGGLARAAIDVSDGLVQDLGHLCEASGVGAVVEVERLPLSRAARAALRGRDDRWDLPLAGGEDYELLAAVPPGRLAAVRAAARRARTPLAVVGRFERGRGVRVVKGGGEPVLLRRAGWDHLRRPRAAFLDGGAPGRRIDR
jgi:thiamine-monophosphate kinase